MSILEKLMGRKKVEEFDAALTEIEQEIETKQARAMSLRGEVAAAAFEVGADKVKELQREARDLEDEIQVLQSVAAETVKRREKAIADETRDAVEKRLAVAEKDRAALVKAWSEFGEHVAALHAALPRMQELSEGIRVGNEFARTNGYSHLQFRVPGANWGAISGLLHQLQKIDASDHFAQLERTSRTRVG